MSELWEGRDKAHAAVYKSEQKRKQAHNNNTNNMKKTTIDSICHGEFIETEFNKIAVNLCLKWLKPKKTNTYKKKQHTKFSKVDSNGKIYVHNTQKMIFIDLHTNKSTAKCITIADCVCTVCILYAKSVAATQFYQTANRKFISCNVNMQIVIQNPKWHQRNRTIIEHTNNGTHSPKTIVCGAQRVKNMLTFRRLFYGMVL